MGVLTLPLTTKSPPPALVGTVGKLWDASPVRKKAISGANPVGVLPRESRLSKRSHSGTINGGVGER